ncbi:YdhK family protein [Brevibacterium renqingii]|uniref:YdhK family protein n=1 Tax=Brevibacterium renqingii TaxID=2776916 RepID=UPI0031B62FC8
MKKPTIRLTAAAAAIGLILAGCSSADGGGKDSGADSGGHGSHAEDGGAPPKGIEKADDPKFDIGDTVVLSADHMSGMKGAEATVSGAFDTTTYAISYTPTDGGDPVKNHKWVVHEELKDPGDAPLQDGAEVTVEADHMPGMKGAKATIDSSTDETVYMVDITTDEMEMTNHKWVTESEMKPAE